MKIRFSEEFKKEFRKIKDKETRKRIIKHIQDLEEQPEKGKPLRHELKNHRSLRIQPHRIVYHIEEEVIIINCFDHRKNVYD